MKYIKKNSAFNYLLVIVIALLSFNCSKDRIQDRSTNDYDATSTNNYLNSKKQTEQEFTIDSAGTGPIIGNQFTTIWGGKNCLRTPSGDTIAYPYIVKLVELYTPKDMIYYQMPTISSDTIMETDGEIRLRAFKNGTELLLNPGCTYLIKMPNTSPKTYMEVFDGVNVSNYVNWIHATPTTTFSTVSGGYTANINKLGWINCGIKRGNATNYHLTFTSTTDNLTNVALFAYFPNTKTVMQIYNLTSGSIPSGSNVKLVAIGVTSSGDLYSFSQNLTVNANASVDVTMVPTTDANLTSYLNGL